MSTARVADLAAQADCAGAAPRHTGISHTRWATHGAPTSANAHPHISGGEIAVVHNGIIENYEALRDRLKAAGYVFNTQTDTEVIAHLVHSHWHADGGGDLVRAVRAAVAEFHGAYAIAVISTREPGRVVGARAGSPLVVGIGDGDHFLASDAAALLSVTRRVVYLDEGDIADVRLRVLRDPRCAAASRWSARSSTWKRRAIRSSSARTAISCRRKSSSSRAPSPTRWKASASSTRTCSAPTRRRFSGRSTACSCWPAAPATIRRWSRSNGSSRSPAFRARSKSRANTVIATASRTRRRSSSWSRNRAKPPTRSPR